MRFLKAASLCVPVLALALGCGGGAANDPAPGTLTLLMGADGFSDYSHVWVTVDKLEYSADGSNWGTFSTTRKSLDLKAAQNGNPATLLSGFSFGPGNINYVRVTWGTVAQNPANGANYVVDASDAALADPHALTMPATTVLPASIPVASSQSVTGQLMISSTQAIQVRTDGTGNPYYAFQATGNGYNLGDCANIQGNLSAGGAALAGVEVYAETLDGNLEPSIKRSAVTNASGHYVLEALPAAAGATYFVVAQPAGATSYLAASSAVQAPSATSYTADLNFATAAAPGALAATITPVSASTQVTWVELRQSFPGQTLIVRAHPVVSGTASDTVSFQGLYPATYGVAAWRSTSGAAAVKKVPASASTVSPGNTTTAAITYN